MDIPELLILLLSDFLLTAHGVLNNWVQVPHGTGQASMLEGAQMTAAGVDYAGYLAEMAIVISNVMSRVMAILIPATT